MLARADAGLLRGYVERELTDTRLRGRIDLPSQLRQPFRAPTLFDQIADEWTADILWNQLPKVTALRLLAEPGLGAEARTALGRAVAAFAEVSDTLPTADERAVMTWDARTEPYRDLINWCDLIGSDGVLVSLERAFEGYVTRLFRDALGDAVRIQAVVTLGSPRPEGERGDVSLPFGSRRAFELIPDLTVFRGHTPASVWDAKWKHPDPTAGDVQQVLAYAAVLGVPACGLVYPGKRWRLDTLQPDGGGNVALNLLRLPLTDDPVRWQRMCRQVRTGCAGGL